MEQAIIILLAALFGATTAYYYWTPKFREQKGLIKKVLRCCKCNSFWTYQIISLLCGYKTGWTPTTFLVGFAAAYVGEWLGDLYAKYDEFRDIQETKRLKAAIKQMNRK